jgi:hypothetical protein
VSPHFEEKVMHLRWIISGVTAVALAATAATAPAPALRIAQAGGGSKSSDMYIIQASEEGIDLSELIRTAKGLTGEEFYFDPREVKDARVNFTGRMSIPKEKFWSFVDWCLHETGFVDCERTVAGVRVHSIVKLGSPGGGGNRSVMALKMSARIVERDELDKLSDRFILVTTTYLCKNLPTREVVTTLQLYFADSTTEAIRSIEGTDLVVMTGFAPNVAAICAMLDRLGGQVGKSERFLRDQELAERVSALESQVATLIKQSQPEEKGEAAGKK